MCSVKFKLTFLCLSSFLAGTLILADAARYMLQVYLILIYNFLHFQGIFTSDIDSWKWRLTTLLHSNDKQELISREKKDRRDYEQIAELATSMGLHRYYYCLKC